MRKSTSARREPRYLLNPGMMPEGRLHIIGGAPHVGKSTLTAQLLRAISQGSPFLGFETSQIPPEQIGVIFTDRPWADNSMALKAAGLGQVAHYSLPDDPNVSEVLKLPNQPGIGVKQFEACLDRLPSGIRLVVADVFTTYFVGGNIFAAHSVATHMTLLQRVLIERDLTLIGLVYGMKQKTGEAERYVVPTERIIGAAPLRGSASTIAYLSSHEESGSQGYQELWIQSRQAPSQHLYVRYMQGKYGFELRPEDLWGEAPQDLDPTPRDQEILRAVRTYNSHVDELEDDDGWVPAKAIRQQLQMTANNFSNYIKRLETLGLLQTHRKGRCLYLRITPGPAQQ